MAGRREQGALDRVAAAIRVAGVPERLAILRLISTHGPTSPSGYAEQSDGETTLREAAYHFRYLRDAELILLHELRTTGGTAQHFYVLSPVAAALVGVLPRLERAAASAA
jgi:hypothetical protein